MNKLLFLLISSFIIMISSCEAQTSIEGAFTHGVASGDPAQESVLLWTRYLAADSSNTRVKWEVATDEFFVYVVKKGETTAQKDLDYCVKVIPEDLNPGSTYYYRFLVGDTYSEVGRTNTLPKEIDQLKIGVVNCAKYTGGYYHAYEVLGQYGSRRSNSCWRLHL